MIEKFADQLKGAKAGDTRDLAVRFADAAAANLGGLDGIGAFSIKDVKTRRFPELTPEFLQEAFGLPAADVFEEQISLRWSENWCITSVDRPGCRC